MLLIITFISTIISALLLTSEIVILEQLGTALFILIGLIGLRNTDQNKQLISEIDTSTDEGV
jgi:hypothetical protein